VDRRKRCQSFVAPAKRLGKYRPPRRSEKNTANRMQRRDAQLCSRVIVKRAAPPLEDKRTALDFPARSETVLIAIRAAVPVSLRVGAHEGAYFLRIWVILATFVDRKVA
jgi:hypothetical protein